MPGQRRWRRLHFTPGRALLGNGEAAPALNGKSVAEVIEAVRRGGSDAFGRIQKVQVQKRELDKEIRALERDLARLKSGAKDVRTIAVGVSARGRAR